MKRRRCREGKRGRKHLVVGESKTRGGGVDARAEKGNKSPPLPPDPPPLPLGIPRGNYKYTLIEIFIVIWKK